MKEDKGGIYGIYVNSELVYIGKTNNFANRFKQHKNSLDKKENLLLYNILSKCDTINICFIPLIYANDIKFKNKKELNQEEIDLIEYGLIKALNPKGNVQFTNKNRKLEVYNFIFDKDVYLWDEEQLHPELIDKESLKSRVETIEELFKDDEKQKLEFYSLFFKYLLFNEKPNGEDELLNLAVEFSVEGVNSYSNINTSLN